MNITVPPSQNMLLAIIERASSAPEFDLERITHLLDLKERWDRAEALKAFTVAMAAFKANPPKIFKDKHVSFRNNKGTLTEYDHASHAEVCEKVAAGLGAHGMSHRWRVEQPDGKVKVTCIVTHADGHSETAEMTAPPDDSGNKSLVQAISSTNTLLQRVTLLAVTGLSAADLPDADDKRGDKPELPDEVWRSLTAAANEGVAALTVAWQSLDNLTRAAIALHYAERWDELKARSQVAV